MSVRLSAYEIRYRIQGSDQPWTYARYAPDTTVITINGLLRGKTYDGEARRLSMNGVPSPWAPVTWEVSTTHREGTTALPPVTTGNVSSRWMSGTEITWSATDTTATVNVSAGVLQAGDQQVSYGASSVEITGAAEEVRTIYLYYDDPFYDGGTRTLGWTTDPVASMAASGRVLIDQVTITFDVAGGSGSSGGGDIGGTSGGLGGTCPDEEAWLIVRGDDGEPEPIQWKDARDGMYALLLDGRWGRLSNLKRFKTASVRVRFGGHSLSCSRTAPLARDKGGTLLAPATVGASMAYRKHGERTSVVVSSVEDIGARWVIRFTCEKSFVWTGDDPEHLLAHHNIKTAPP